MGLPGEASGNGHSEEAVESEVVLMSAPEQKGQNDYCPKCEEFNRVLYGICCRCKRHIYEDRPATEAELKEIEDELDSAIAGLETALDDFDEED